MRRSLVLFAGSLITAAPCLVAQTASPTATTPSTVLLKGLKARSIGPAVMGGRVSDIALHPHDRSTFYVALGSGGVMKTSDNGGTFSAVFEKEPVASVGAVAVSPAAPDIVWVGTGEANDRNSSGWGNGVYRSTDGGDTWTHRGLELSKTIARIVPHPTDSNTAYVAVMGDLWGPSPGRGLYKTTDGGATWKAALTAPAPYADRVGCGDVALDPADPNTIYAALYARRRQPWAFRAGPDYTDGKDVGGIFKSTDGGATWKKLGGGLPPNTGRIGLAVFPKDPRIVYAVVQSDEGGTSGIDDVRSKNGGIFRTDDGGASWTQVNRLNPRPFYFSQIRVDPDSSRRVYVLGFVLHVSEDGGATFREDRFKHVHADTHALVIDPNDPKRLLLGTDGGVYQSFDGGQGWAFLDRFAGGEFYRINVDMSTPYRICGGLQDNGNWVGPSTTRSKEGIRNADWIMIGGWDGFFCAFDTSDRNLVFAESQRGSLYRFNLSNGEMKELRPEPTEGQPGFRFHWNAPLIGSRYAMGVLYLAGNRVFRLTERGDRWQAISPDLSTQDLQKAQTIGSGAETYGVVYTLAESPSKEGMLWAGTDDGRLWLTENDGGSWTDLTPKLPAAVTGQWINRVEAGVDPEVAYLAVDAHRTGTYAPLAYRTADRGKTWRSIAGDLPAHGPVRVIREDPKKATVLYAGTEFGLFVTTDAGRHWANLGSLPTVAVDDIVIHARDQDLVVATHGRSLYIIDDVTPIEELAPATLAGPAHLFPPPAAYGVYPFPGWVGNGGNAVFRGENPPEGALLTYYLKDYTGDEVKIVVADSGGRPVAKLTGPGAPGMNRVAWDLKPTKDLITEYGGQPPAFVKSGVYTVTLRYGETKREQRLRVKIAAGLETR